MEKITKNKKKNHSLCFLGWWQSNRSGLGDFFFLNALQKADSNLANLKASVKLLLLLIFLSVYRYIESPQSHSDGRKKNPLLQHCMNNFDLLHCMIRRARGRGLSQMTVSISAQETWNCLEHGQNEILKWLCRKVWDSCTPRVFYYGLSQHFRSPLQSLF